MVQTRSVKRRRASRKRAPGERYSNGHLKSAPERGWAHMSVVLDARCRHRGWRVTDDALRKARDPLEGHVLGRLLNDKAITEAQHDAGRRFEVVYCAWAKSAGMPRITAPAGSYGQSIPGRDEVPDDVAATAERVYWAAALALLKAGKMVEWWTKRVCLEDCEADNMGAVAAGLDRLVDHFG